MSKDILNQYASALRTKTVLWYVDKTPSLSILTRIYITSYAVVKCHQLLSGLDHVDRK